MSSKEHFGWMALDGSDRERHGKVLPVGEVVEGVFWMGPSVYEACLWGSYNLFYYVRVAALGKVNLKEGGLIEATKVKVLWRVRSHIPTVTWALRLAAMVLEDCQSTRVGWTLPRAHDLLISLENHDRDLGALTEIEATCQALDRKPTGEPAEWSSPEVSVQLVCLAFNLLLRAVEGVSPNWGDLSRLLILLGLCLKDDPQVQSCPQILDEEVIWEAQRLGLPVPYSVVKTYVPTSTLHGRLP